MMAIRGICRLAVVMSERRPVVALACPATSGHTRPQMGIAQSVQAAAQSTHSRPALRSWNRTLADVSGAMASRRAVVHREC